MAPGSNVVSCTSTCSPVEIFPFTTGRVVCPLLVLACKSANGHVVDVSALSSAAQDFVSARSGRSEHSSRRFIIRSLPSRFNQSDILSTMRESHALHTDTFCDGHCKAAFIL